MKRCPCGFRFLNYPRYADLLQQALSEPLRVFAEEKESMSIITITEKDVQSAVIDWINTLPNSKVFRRNVGAMEYRKANGKKGIVRFGQPGMADLWGIVNGVHVEIEVKRPGERPSTEQTHWLTLMRERGSIAFWVDSLRSCTDQLRYEFQQRNWSWRKEWEVL